MKKQSQNKWVFKWLSSGKTLTPREADNKKGIMRLASRIRDLKLAGHRIENLNRSGYAKYRLIDG